MDQAQTLDVSKAEMSKEGSNTREYANYALQEGGGVFAKIKKQYAAYPASGSVCNRFVVVNP